jgi:hypothetical protein
VVHGKYGCGTCSVETLTDFMLLTSLLHSSSGADEEASGPLTYMGPIEGPSIVFTLSYIFENFAKVKCFNHSRLIIIEVCQAVDYYRGVSGS